MIRPLAPLRMLALAALLATCTAYAQRESALVWPKPPDTARIRMQRVIASPRDIEGEAGFFSRAVQWLFGRADDARWLLQPVGIAVSPKGILYVADPGAHGIHRIDLRGEDYSFTQRGMHDPLVSPVGVAVSVDGTVYVADSQRKTVTAYSADLSPRFEITDSLVRPAGVAVIGGVLYVADAGAHRIAKYALDGSLMGTFGGRGSDSGSFNFPVALSGDSALYIVDALNHRIQRCSTTGASLGSFGSIGSSGGFFSSPKSVALDSEHHVYVTDALQDAVQIFDSQGSLLLVFGGHGSGSGEFQAPSGVAIDASDTIYVVDSLNRRIQTFAYIKQAER